MPREVHPGDRCPNLRPKPRPVVRGQPPEPPPGVKYIPLTRGLWATVDEVDFDRLNQHHWYAMIKHQGVTSYLGTFDTEIEAAQARDRKAYELEGEFAYLNFPEDFPPQKPPPETP